MNEGRLSTIEAFLAVADSGGFGAAARTLGLNQSTVSRRVAQLEARLGVRLVARTTRSVSLTPAGEVFAARAREALGRLDDAEAEAGAAQADAAGLVRITASTAFGRAVVAPALGALLEDYPRLRIELDLSDRYADLAVEPFDLAVRLSSEAPSGWVATPIGRIAPRLCAAPAYVARHGAPAQPEDLDGHRIAVARTYSPRTAWRLAWGGRVRRIDVSPAATVSDFHALLDLVRAGGGVAALPDFLCDAALRAGELVELLPGALAGSVTAHAVIPSHLRRARRVEVAVEAIRRCATRNP